MFSGKFFSNLIGAKFRQTKPKDEQKEYGFFFPETLIAYKNELARLDEESRRAKLIVGELEVKYVSVPSGKNVTEELERRRAEKSQREQIDEAKEELRKLLEAKQKLVRVFQKREIDRYLSEGVEIIRSSKTSNDKSHTDERIVLWWREKFVLLNLSRKCILGYGDPDYGGYSGFPSVEGHEDPIISWITELPARFSYEELEAIERFHNAVVSRP